MTPPASTPAEGARREPVHPVQAMVAGWSAIWQQQRAAVGLTLGKLIAALEALPPERRVVGFGDAESYRGYYCDLSFDPDDKPRTVADLLTECRAAMGKAFTGYKGGEFVMGEHTPLWISPYGHSSGMRLVGLSDTDPIHPLTEVDVDD